MKYDAINKGAKLATGELLGFLNADDFYARHESLKHVAAPFQGNSVDVYFGDLEYVDRHNPQIVLRHWQTGTFAKGRFALGWAPPHPAFFVRWSVYESVGDFNTDYELGRPSLGKATEGHDAVDVGPAPGTFSK